MQRLTDRVGIVTGGAQGIGGATARRLAEEGARVLVVDIDEHLMERNVAIIRAAGGTAEALRADVGTEDGVREMIDRAVALFGRLDIVVNNAYAGVGGPRKDATAISEAAWEASFNVGLKAMFRA